MSFLDFFLFGFLRNTPSHHKSSQTPSPGSERCLSVLIVEICKLFRHHPIWPLWSPRFLSWSCKHTDLPYFVKNHTAPRSCKISYSRNARLVSSHTMICSVGTPDVLGLQFQIPLVKNMESFSWRSPFRKAVLTSNFTISRFSSCVQVRHAESHVSPLENKFLQFIVIFIIFRTRFNFKHPLVPDCISPGW